MNELYIWFVRELIHSACFPATCGLSGVRRRTATTCDNPTPLLGGEDCNESDGVEIGACNRIACQGINVRLARVY